MSTKIEVGDVIRLKQGTIATVIAVENDCINVSWKECGKWYTSYVNISEVEKLERLSELIDNFKTVDSDRWKAEAFKLELLEQLITGIETWAAEEDGVPDHVWNAYCQARLAIGKPLETNPSILQAVKAITNATKVESAACASGKHYFQPMPHEMTIFGYLYCVHCGLRTFGKVG